jgi:hypothetical protein
MTCDDFRALLIGDRRGRGLTRAERFAVTGHMDDCPECLLLMMRALRETLNHLPPERFAAVAARTRAIIQEDLQAEDPEASTHTEEIDR